MMGTEIFKIDASWAEKLTKTRVSFLMTPTVSVWSRWCFCCLHWLGHAGADTKICSFNETVHVSRDRLTEDKVEEGC